jgi:hypothetical protein
VTEKKFTIQIGDFKTVAKEAMIEPSPDLNAEMMKRYNEFMTDVIKAAFTVPPTYFFGVATTSTNTNTISEDFLIKTPKTEPKKPEPKSEYRPWPYAMED